MKTKIYISISFLVLSLSASAAQKDSAETVKNIYPLRIVTIEPAIGMETSQLFDLVISNLVQWNLKKRLGLISYTSYSYNDAMDRDFNYIKTDYNYSLSQKFGIGTSLFTRHTSHTFSFLAGIRYDALKVTMENPELEKVSASLSSVSPDLGLMYNLKIGKKKYFFSYRMFIPFYPYPFKTSDFWAIDGNAANLSLEFGLGIRLK
jgi:hypothetical protein